MVEREDIVKEVIMEKNKKTSKDVLKKDKTRTTGVGSGLRFNEGKLRYDLVHPKAYEDFVQVLTDGANKYYDRNWENGLSWTSVIASLKRHINAIERGEDYDPESGRLHIAHAACNVHFLNAFYHIFPQGDDRPKKFLKIPKIGLDIDGVLANFAGAWNKLHPEILAKPNTWFFDRKIERRFVKMTAENSLDDFYLNKIEPLIKAEDLPFEPHCYITLRPVSVEITEQWLDKHNFPAKKVYSIDFRKINTKDGGMTKADAAKEAGVDIFVDDCFENFVQLNNEGIFTYLYDATYNQKHDVGHMRIKSLKDIPILT